MRNTHGVATAAHFVKSASVNPLTEKKEVAVEDLNSIIFLFDRVKMRSRRSGTDIQKGQGVESGSKPSHTVPSL